MCFCKSLPGFCEIVKVDSRQPYRGPISRQLIAVSGPSNLPFFGSLNVRYKVLPRFGGHLKIGAIMRWEVSDDEEEAI